MCLRSLAVVVAFVLLYSGFGSAGTSAAARPAGIEAADTTLAPALHAAAIDEPAHSTDDLRTPFEAEGAQELPLLHAPVALTWPGLSSPRPRRLGIAAMPSPFVEGLQRPPSAARIPA